MRKPHRLQSDVVARLNLPLRLRKRANGVNDIIRLHARLVFFSRNSKHRLGIALEKGNANGSFMSIEPCEKEWVRRRSVEVVVLDGGEETEEHAQSARS